MTSAVDVDAARARPADRARVDLVHPPHHRDRQALAARERGAERRAVVARDAGEHEPRAPGRAACMARSTASSVPATSKATSTSAPAGTSSGAATSSAPARCGRLAAVRQRVDGERHARAGGARDLDQQQPDRAAADHRDVVAEVHVAEVEGVDRHAQRLEHRAGRAVHRVRQRVQRLGRPAQVLAQAAVAVAVAGEDDVRAEVRWPSRQRAQTPHVQRRVDRDAAAVERPALDHAGELVAEHERAASSRASPIPPSSYQCRSEPQRPTASTRTRLSPGPGVAHGLVGDARRRRCRAAARRPRSTDELFRRGRREAVHEVVAAAAEVVVQPR